MYIYARLYCFVAVCSSTSRASRFSRFFFLLHSSDLTSFFLSFRNCRPSLYFFFASVRPLRARVTIVSNLKHIYPTKWRYLFMYVSILIRMCSQIFIGCTYNCARSRRNTTTVKITSSIYDEKQVYCALVTYTHPQ